MQDKVLVVGGGMAGLSAALVCARSAQRPQVELWEQAEAFAEVGAGIQLGPNATRVLGEWGLSSALSERAAFPERLKAFDMDSGRELGTLRLGNEMVAKYGSPYASIHRADLHALLLQAVEASGQVQLRLGQRLGTVMPDDDKVAVTDEAGETVETDVLLACDGVWSRVREQLLRDGPPVFSGHLAYRGMVRMSDLPAPLRLNQVSVWMGAQAHAVHYPVSRGEWMNVVVIVHGQLPEHAQSWDHAAHATDLRLALGEVAAPLRALLEAVRPWRLWPLNVREPMASAREHGSGRVALLGDAAHPMRPYLAQGAAMALEDAWLLGRLLQEVPRESQVPWSGLLQRWANARWPRNAWVQARSRRNGQIFHAEGPIRWARNGAMALLGESIMDVPALYSGPPLPP